MICNPQRYGAALSRNALNSWKNRCNDAVSGRDARLCFLCVERGDSGQVNELRGGSRSERRRNPTRDWSLFNISIQDGPVQTLFTAELTRLSGCEIRTAEPLISDPSTHFLCYYHLNHSRIAREVVLDNYCIGRQKCVFELRGCSLKGSAARSARLWSMKDVSVESLNDFEYYTDLDERIRSHSYGELSSYEVMNQFCCRSCLYIITEGRSETRPAVSLTSISSSVDRFLVRCIFFSLESEDAAEKSSIVLNTASKDVAVIARQLRVNCIRPGKEASSYVQMLPFTEVCRARERLCSIHENDHVVHQFAIDPRTL